jgi:hypothetical protein
MAREQIAHEATVAQIWTLRDGKVGVAPRN